MTKPTSILLPTLYILILLSFTFSMSHYLPVLQRMWLFVGLGFVLPLFVCPSFYRSKTFVCYVVYIGIVSFSYLIGRNYFVTPGYFFRETYIMIIPASIFFTIIKTKEMRIGEVILYAFMFILFYTTIISFIIDLQFPGIIRTAFSAGREGGSVETLSEGFYKMGLSSYELPHALPVLIPALIAVCFHAEQKMMVKLLFMLFLLSILVLVYISASTTALFLSFIIVAISIVVRYKATSQNVKWLLFFTIFITPFVLNQEIQLFILDSIDSLFGENLGFHGKIMDIENSIVFQSEDIGAVGARTEQYNSSWNTLQDNILLGGSKVGGHSALLDRLATLGIVGFIPFMLFVISQIKYTINYIPQKVQIYYYIGLFSCIIMLATKNMSNWYMWLCAFVILPLLLILNFKKTDKNESLYRNSSITTSGRSINAKN